MSAKRVQQLTAAGKLTGLRSPFPRGVAKIAAPLVVGLAALAFSAAPALAAAPEAPAEVTVQEPVHATEAVFHGFLNPSAPEQAKPGTYEFLYKKSPTECKGGSKAPVSPAISLGFPHEEVSETVTGLEPGATYTVCLLARNGTKVGENEAVSTPPVTFTTATLAAEPKTEPVTGETATTAMLHGVLNPTVEAEAGWYFVYSPGAKCTSGGTGSGETGHEPPAKVEALVVEPSVAGLEPNKSYKVCLVATNTAGDTTVGNEVSFTTKPLPPAIESESTSEVKTTGATLDAQINTNNQKTKYTFEYSTAGSEGPAGKLEGTIVKENGLSELKAEDVNQLASVALTGLEAGKTYYYRVVATNATAEKTEGAVRSFTTVPTPSTVSASDGAPVTATTATFGGSLKPLNATVPTRYYFAYDIGSSCTGAGGLTTATVEAGTSAVPGTEVVAPPTEVKELQPFQQYTVCLVVSNAYGSVEGPEREFSTLAVPPKIDSEGVSGVTPSEATLEAQVNPNNRKTTYTFEYATQAKAIGTPGATVLPGGELKGFGDKTASAPTGAVLTAGVTYYYRVVVENTEHPEVIDGAVQSFTPQGNPLAFTEAAQNVTRTTASVSGSVNPAGSETHYHFAYIEHAAYEKALAGDAEEKADPYALGRSTSEATVPAGYTAVPTGPVLLVNLPPGSTFDYALIATNSPGTNIIGANGTFTTSPSTPPVLTGVSVQGVSQTAATISATLEAQNLPTRWELQLGSTPGLLAPVSSGTATLTTPLSLPVQSLSPGTTYYYKLVAVNPDGSSGPEGEGSFTTSPAPAGAAPRGLPATGPYQSIAELNAKEALEDKKLPNPVITKTLTKAEKLKKALKACHKKKGSKRTACEKAAHKKFGSSKKKK
jgi:hypothetical protein